MEDYQKIVREKKLPGVGQTVRSKKFGTLWRVLEKKEVWNNIDPHPKTGRPPDDPGHLSHVLEGSGFDHAGGGQDDGLFVHPVRQHLPTQLGHRALT